MKQSVFELLMYLFDNFFWEEDLPENEQGEIEEELLGAGFDRATIDKAFGWLDDLAQLAGSESGCKLPESGLRVFTASEQAQMDRDCRGLLLSLQQRGLLDAAGREAVIERTMALDGEDVEIEQLKWIVSMVMFNRGGKEMVEPRMEEFVLNDRSMTLH